MALGIANITPWRWNLVENCIWFDGNRELRSGATSEMKEDSFAMPVSEIVKGIHKDDLKRVKEAFRDLRDGKKQKVNENFVHYPVPLYGYTGWRFGQLLVKRMMRVSH